MLALPAELLPLMGEFGWCYRAVLEYIYVQK
jgi:hypothetical protein